MLCSPPQFFYFFRIVELAKTFNDAISDLQQTAASVFGLYLLFAPFWGGRGSAELLEGPLDGA